MATTETRYAFNYWRGRGCNARKALQLARIDVAAGCKRYTSSPWRKVYGCGAAFDGYGTKAMRFVEPGALGGLRFAGYADEIANIGHTGWFADPYQDRTLRGVVYQLPARNGETLFLSGYTETDADGTALDFGTIWRGDKTAAAYHADKIAERAAEQEREYQTAWEAGRQFAELGDRVKETRAELLVILSERRRAKADGANYPALCNTLRMQVRNMLASIAGWRKEREQLEGGDAADLYFYPSKELRAAFAEGAAG